MIADVNASHVLYGDGLGILEKLSESAAGNLTSNSNSNIKCLMKFVYSIGKHGRNHTAMRCPPGHSSTNIFCVRTTNMSSHLSVRKSNITNTQTCL
uniref:Uncharacterized protein n=1 Tax=Pararge aegeria TaxID=116150 RepID=S4PD82_9NEOP